MNDSRSDEQLLADLRRIASIVDPVPSELVEFARESLTWRRVDAELATLLADSSVEEERVALIRSSGGVRVMTFEAEGMTIELDLLDEAGRRRLVGQLMPPCDAAVEIQGTRFRSLVRADVRGRFRAENVPAGHIRLRLTGYSETGPPLETSWIVI
jgi:hypothetical protein